MEKISSGSPICAIHVVLKRGESGECFGFYRYRYEIMTNRYITIGHLKDLIQDVTAITPNNQKLKYHDVTLYDDHNTLLSYGIGHDSTVVLYELHKGGATCEIHVLVKRVSTGESFGVTCGHHITIGHLKDLIQDVIGIAPNNQKLKYHDVTLSNHNMLLSYGIVHNSTVELYEPNYEGSINRHYNT